MDSVSKEYIVQIPRPLFEMNTFEYGVSLFEQIQARALLIGGTNPYANTDGSADLIRMKNKENLFVLVNQVIMRESPEISMMVIQVRGLGLKRDGSMPDYDAILTMDRGISDKNALSTIGREFIDY